MLDAHLPPNQRSLQVRDPNSSQPRGPLLPHLTAPLFLGRAVPPPTAGARSPARLGPLGVQHELAEATPEGAACEQHRAQLHEQLQYPSSRTHLRRHLGEGQSATASTGSGRPALGVRHVTSGLAGFVFNPSVGKQASCSVVLDRCPSNRVQPFPRPMEAYSPLSVAEKLKTRLKEQLSSGHEKPRVIT